MITSFCVEGRAAKGLHSSTWELVARQLTVKPNQAHANRKWHFFRSKIPRHCAQSSHGFASSHPSAPRCAWTCFNLITCSCASGSTQVRYWIGSGQNGTDQFGSRCLRVVLRMRCWEVAGTTYKWVWIRQLNLQPPSQLWTCTNGTDGLSFACYRKHETNYFVSKVCSRAVRDF